MAKNKLKNKAQNVSEFVENILSKNEEIPIKEESNKKNKKLKRQIDEVEAKIEHQPGFNAPLKKKKKLSDNAERVKKVEPEKSEPSVQNESSKKDTANATDKPKKNKKLLLEEHLNKKKKRNADNVKTPKILATDSVEKVDAENSEQSTQNETVKEEAEEKPKKKKNSYKDLMNDDEKKRTMFVGNLPIGATKRDILKIFKDIGDIDSVRLRSIVPLKPKMSKKVAAIKQEISSDNKDNVNAYVKFKNAQSVKKALKLNGHLFGEHRLQLDACSNEKHDNRHSVFVGNLPLTVKEDALINHFTDCGEVERVRIVRDKATGQGKGIAFVLFKELSSVEMALKLSGENFEKRPLRIGRAVKRVNKKSVNDDGQKMKMKKRKQKKTKNAPKSFLT